MSTVLLRAPGRLWGSYMRTLAHSPVRTKIATSMAAACIGDYIAQKISHRNCKEYQYDWLRTAHLALFNAGMGCLGHFYYGALDARVGLTAPTAPPTVATKVAIDQLIFSPICTLAFYAYKVTAEGRPTEYFKELEQKLWPTLKAGWSLWPAAHVINFALIPTHHRILYANVVSVAGTYLLSRASAGDFSTATVTTNGGDGRGKGEEEGEKKKKRTAGGMLPSELPNEVIFDGVAVKYD